jgi:hypothetical protein
MVSEYIAPSDVLADTIKFETVEFSARFAQIGAAVAAAQALFGAYSPDHKGSIKSERAQFTYNYAKLPDVIGATRSALNAQGVAVFQPATARGQVVTVETLLMHKDEWILNRLSIKAVNDSPMSIGSAMTYARRYSLQALLCVAPDQDDDGAGAQGDRDPHRREEVVEEVGPAIAERRALEESDRKAVGWIEARITKRNIPAESVLEAVRAIAPGLDDWRALNLEGKRTLFADLDKRFPMPKSDEPKNGSGDAQSTPADTLPTETAATASERSETNVLTGSQDTSGELKPQTAAGMADWTQGRLRALELADDDAYLLETVCEVSVEIDERTTYDWRTLSPKAMRELVRRAQARDLVHP